MQLFNVNLDKKKLMTKKNEKKEALKFLAEMPGWWLHKCCRELGLYVSGTRVIQAKRLIAYYDLSPKDLKRDMALDLKDYV